ncbi:hypothetical protein BCR39DRAFT_552869 [Naematelia encephala]|uniref:Uncharacterized protein n=1 Tax=Naematelia encephala TaxID=71784 RepID=A0A1Y2AGW0_9TREE|nr:hypothetical protein BCR39DRAFT_552869 [Naematelia encephala]
MRQDGLTYDSLVPRVFRLQDGQLRENDREAYTVAVLLRGSELDAMATSRSAPQHQPRAFVQNAMIGPPLFRGEMLSDVDDWPTPFESGVFWIRGGNDQPRATPDRSHSAGRSHKAADGGPPFTYVRRSLGWHPNIAGVLDHKTPRWAFSSSPDFSSPVVVTASPVLHDIDDSESNVRLTKLWTFIEPPTGKWEHWLRAKLYQRSVVDYERARLVATGGVVGEPLRRRGGNKHDVAVVRQIRAACAKNPMFAAYMSEAIVAAGRDLELTDDQRFAAKSFAQECVATGVFNANVLEAFMADDMTPGALNAFYDEYATREDRAVPPPYTFMDESMTFYAQVISARDHLAAENQEASQNL